MKTLIQFASALCLAGWGSYAQAAPVTAEFDLIIDDCVIFDTGVPYIFADDCTGTVTVTTDTDITYDTPDIGQTGSARLLITSPTYGKTGAQFFNFIEFYLYGPNGTLIPICLSYCFYTDVNDAGDLSFSWGAYRGIPYSNGQFSGATASGTFEYEDTFFVSGKSSNGMIANGKIVPKAIATVPLPASGLALGAVLLALWARRRKPV
jgi:hypothetical protein